MANGNDKAEQRRRGVGDENLTDLVQEFRKQRRARNVRALGQGLSGLGRTMRGQAADVDTDFILGGTEGQDAWMTAEEKRKELRDLELQQRQEQLQRDKMDLQQRQALMSFIDSAMSRKLSREEGRLNREQKERLAAAQMRVQGARTRIQQNDQNTKLMGAVAADAAQILETEEARQRVKNYKDNLAKEGYIIVPGDETRSGRILDAPIVRREDVDKLINLNPTALGYFSRGGKKVEDLTQQELETAIGEAYLNSQVSRSQFFKDIDKSAGIDRARLANDAARTAKAEIPKYQEAAVMEATKRLAGVPANATNPLSNLDSASRVELEMALAERGLNMRVASPGGAGSPSDYAIYEQQRNRTKAVSSAATTGVARIAAASPEVFDPTEIAQIQEVARMMGFQPTKSASEAIEAAKVSAGREGVTDTQAAAQAAQQVRQEQPAQESWLGIPGLKKPSDPREESLQAMQMIADMPELPPLQQARKQLVQSPEFLRYQKERGYTDERETVRQMVKEARQQDRQAARDTRSAVRENKQLGIVPETPEEMAKRKETQNKVKEPEAPVEGAIG